MANFDKAWTSNRFSGKVHVQIIVQIILQIIEMRLSYEIVLYGRMLALFRRGC